MTGIVRSQGTTIIAAPGASTKLKPENVSVESSAKALLLKSFHSQDASNLNVPSLSTPMQKSIKPIVLEVDPARNPFELPDVLPPLPTKDAIRRRRPRSRSEGDIGSQGRRAIFGQYWNKDESHASQGSIGSGRGAHTLKAPVENPKTTKKRSNSESIILIAHMEEELRDFRMFAPPKELLDTSPICGRFASVEDVGTGNLLHTLPPLPMPLQRLCSEGDSPGCLHGMYPLMTPKSILRRSSFMSPSSTHLRVQSQVETHDQNQAREASFDTDSSGSSYGRNSVRFDPRVTVSEFEDPIERCWYDDEELEFLKHETILLAQEYLLANPEEAVKYSEAKLDPVTGTMRKRALFSLPILSAFSNEAVPDRDGSEYQDLLQSQVKSILIVDPNRAILDLFAKSMVSMFPKASVQKTQSADEALKMVEATLRKGFRGTPFIHRNFDIIIVEQRLYRSDPAKAKTHSFREASSFEAARPSFGSLVKPNSFSERQQPTSLSMTNTVCGSDILRSIQQLERDEFELSQKDRKQVLPTRSESSRISTNSFLGKALLVGVSVKPDSDAKLLREAGADIVWGKPIPRVGDALRNQLLNTLVSKRKRPASHNVSKGEDVPVQMGMMVNSASL